MKKIRRAVISVTDKAGIEVFSKALSSMGVEIISTGGTSKLLKENSIPVIPISSYTGFPEMLGGRVKTLHPKILGGILAIRESEEHTAEMETHGILPVDMVVVNLYAFEQTVASGASLEDAIENIDIGGPTMLRAGAKNFRDVACVTDPADYDRIIEEMKAHGNALSLETRFYLARKVFELTARYDGAISNHLGTVIDSKADPERFPQTLSLQFRKVMDLRYGENPHQGAAFYAETDPPPASLANAIKHQGKDLSFNNILDLNSAASIAGEFDEPAAVIIKHNNPAGAAISADGPLSAYEKALACDSKSAFGGIAGFNRTVDEEVARKLSEIFLEAVIAPGYEPKALEAFKGKKNLRIIETGEPDASAPARAGLDIKMVRGGALVQTLDVLNASKLKTVTKRGPTDRELEDLVFAWKVCKHVKSNAIILVCSGATVGVGAGQMSRIDATRIAVMKAGDAGLELGGAVLASDAFFPFRDNVDLAAEHGITAIIQPGGSIRDEEVIKAANEHNIAMVFTGIRHFRH